MTSDWIAAVNRGEILPMTQVAARPLDAEALVAEAAARQGQSPERGADVEAIRTPLEVFTKALEEEAELTIYGRWLTRRFLLRLLEVRLQMAQYVEADPGALEEEIVTPIFLVGAPRSGTTILYNSLGQDPGLRVPQGWEYLRPVPPPLLETPDDDPRIVLAAQELQAPQLVSSGLEAVHAYSGRMSKECLSAMSFSFRSEELISRYHVPSYVQWFRAADLAPSYVMQKLVLQILQRQQPGTRWVLKSPVHQGSLDALLSVFPDAQLVMTHRDPMRILGSVTSLIAKLRAAFSDHVDATTIGAYHAALYQQRLDRLVDDVPDRTIHVDFTVYQRDRLAETRRVHEALGLGWSDAVAAKVDAFLDNNRPAVGGVDHAYSFDDMGLDEDVVRAGFARYAETFLLSDPPSPTK